LEFGKEAIRISDLRALAELIFIRLCITSQKLLRPEAGSANVRAMTSLTVEIWDAISARTADHGFE
jgi:hypothetical protein